ncbi:MAG: GNAT family N-acetyltransferase [Alphaproteobacteria bacterium]|nr:GNAT family N-acetyltransferase [Alphaproteobacteria bacterium]MBU0794149.1 GNAT family N-acetyltransferase [Alphaproteobacteria bacterium]MBU0876708.1 GNAT family N-acetyltransferase [Alphaproteobacteria bacterium]MBU1769410.1 GNAT family N-acetyltransferase [Alphaproteobacteria bacterium]
MSDALTVHLTQSVTALDRADWDACAGPDNPFISYDFLSILEESGSVGPGTGWSPAPITIQDADGTIVAAAPAYLKGHSQGEYVFDHGWADAWERAGGQYYPKLQIAAPFSPVPGPRLLLRDSTKGASLIAGVEAVVDQNNLSSAHATFIAPEECELYRAAGWLIRQGSQFHWANQGYGSFDDFLACLSSRHRKDLRKERAKAQAGLDIRHLTGSAIEERHWDAFWQFYQDTGSRKWGQPYLTREFFSLLGERMADKVLLIMAFRDDQPIAGALNLIGGEALYGRYWGCCEDVPFLHFELCYYQAIDAAIARGLGRVEAGAQGEHKLSRGYRPVPTFSAHYIPHPDFRRAVADFVEREAAAIAREREWLDERAPFKKSEDAG